MLIINDDHDDVICSNFCHNNCKVRVRGKFIEEGFLRKKVKTFTTMILSSSRFLVPSLSSQPTLMPSEHPSLLPFMSSYVILFLVHSASTIPYLSIQPSDVSLEWACSQISIDAKTMAILPKLPGRVLIQTIM